MCLQDESHGEINEPFREQRERESERRGGGGDGRRRDQT